MLISTMDHEMRELVINSEGIELLLKDHEFELNNPDSFPEIYDLRPAIESVVSEMESLRSTSPDSFSETEKKLIEKINDDFVRVIIDDGVVYKEDYMVRILEPRIAIARQLGLTIAYKQKDPSVYKQFLESNNMVNDNILGGLSFDEYKQEKQWIANDLARRAVLINKWQLDTGFCEIPHYYKYNNSYVWERFDVEAIKYSIDLGFGTWSHKALDKRYLPGVLVSIFGMSEDLGFDNLEIRESVHRFFDAELLRIKQGHIRHIYDTAVLLDGIKDIVFEGRSQDLVDVKIKVIDSIVNQFKMESRDDDQSDHMAKEVARIFLTQDEYKSAVYLGYIEGLCKWGNFKEPEKFAKYINKTGIDIKENLCQSDLLPDWFNDLVNVFEINSFEELVDFVLSNSRLLNLLMDKVEQRLSLTSLEIKKVIDLPINFYRAEQLKRNGFDLLSLNMDKDEDFENMYRALLETDKHWIDDENGYRQAFESGAKIFGYKNMLEYIGFEDYDINVSLKSFDEIIKFYRSSDMEANDFFIRILKPVSQDKQTYYEEEDSDGNPQLRNNSRDQLVYIGSNFDYDFGTQISVASKLSHLPEIGKLIPKLQDPKNQIFSSWDALKTYHSERKQLHKAIEINTDIAHYPQNAEVSDLFTLYNKPQVGDKILRALRGLHDFDYKKQIVPLMAAQGDGSYLYLERMSTMVQNRQLSESECNYVVQVAKRYGTQARNILENIVMKVESIDKEKDKIELFLSEIGITDFDTYKKYSSLLSSGDFEGVNEIKLSIKTLQQNIYSGQMSEEDFNNPLYEAVSFYTFPPAIGVTQNEYLALNAQRPDRRSDVPQELKGLQYSHMEVKTGRYFVGEGKELELENWDTLGRVIRKVNKEYVDEKMTTEEKIRSAEVLLGLFKTGGIKTPDQKTSFYETMYRYHLGHGGAKLEDGYQMTLESLMVYKEFIGEKVKNNLIRDCLTVYANERPAEMAKLTTDIENRSKKQSQGNIGTLKNLLKSVRTAKDDQKRAKAIGLVDSFLSGTGLDYEQIKDKKPEQYIECLSPSTQEEKPEELVYKKVSSVLASGINNSMRNEVEKFEFENDGGVSSETLSLEFIISKKREHGVAGYTMGVCVTPDETLWDDPEFWNGILFDPETKQSMGGIHFLVRDGCLTLPGINPSLEVLATVDQEELFDKIIEIAKKIQITLGLKKLLIPVEPEIHSNRSQIQEIIRKRNYPVYKFEKVQSFSHYPHPYSIQETFEIL